jgi:hypothetical protein
MTPRARSSLKTVCEYMEEHGLEPDPAWLPVSAGKDGHKSMLRHLVWEDMLICNPLMTYRQIARETGASDHASVIYGIRRAPHWHQVLRLQKPHKIWVKNTHLTTGPETA